MKIRSRRGLGRTDGSLGINSGEEHEETSFSWALTGKNEAVLGKEDRYPKILTLISLVFTYVGSVIDGRSKFRNASDAKEMNYTSIRNFRKGPCCSEIYSRRKRKTEKVGSDSALIFGNISTSPAGRTEMWLKGRSSTDNASEEFPRYSYRAAEI